MCSPPRGHKEIAGSKVSGDCSAEVVQATVSPEGGVGLDKVRVVGAHNVQGAG
ncbi:MAG: hypothetical protein GWM92_19520 [Gemmatimonadetes bacterium]|nr:hypothetical protein [Gemmatimonadota bacterium]NIT89824.1 hypothetical protein [Gemmatimonadota bacterium]NIU80582.1 hypothetical protein [Gammaproteobacteria bacterium]NIY13338.1 hypothetical protein [Gemmatimonadota bacterium]NIY41531.1 hypothetical protein [Gemmatimonadota bacterium]